MSQLDPIPMTLMGGVNLLTDPLHIQDDESVSLKNLYPTINGKMEKRRGPIHAYHYEHGVGVDLSTHVPVNFWNPKFRLGSDVLISLQTADDTMWVSSAEGTVMDENGLPQNSDTRYWTQHLQIPNAQTGFRPAMVEYQNRIIILAGMCQDTGESVFEVVNIDPDNNFLTIRVVPIYFRNAAGKFLAPRCVGVFRSRVVYGNFGPGLENIFVFADTGQPYKINAGTAGTPASQTLNVETSGGRALELLQLQGDSCVVMGEIAVAATGAPLQSAMIVLGAHTAIFMTGVPLQTDDTPPVGGDYLGTLTPRLFNVSCGCVSADTFVKTPQGFVWASWNDVWALGLGGVPTRVGTKIRPALSACSPTDRFRWHAAYHHGTGSYRLAIVSQSQTTLGNLTEACFDQWWLDLTNGIPEAAKAAWYGPQQFRMANQRGARAAYPGTFYMRALERDDVEPKLLGVHVTNMIAATNSRVPCFIEFDANEGWDLASPIVTLGLTDAEVTTRTADPNNFPGWVGIQPFEQLDNEISYEIISKVYNFGDNMVDKGFLGMEVSAWVNDPCHSSLEVICDGGRDRLTIDVDFDQFGYVLGVDPLQSYFTHQYQAVAMLPEDGARLVGKTFQFRLYDTPGWPVPENGINSAFVVQSFPGEDEGPEVTIQVPPDFYANGDAFLEALATAMRCFLDDTCGQSGGNIWSAQYDGDQLFINFQNNIGTEWTFVVDSTDQIFREDYRRSRKLVGWLGFQTASDSLSTAGVKEATNNVPFKMSAHIELAALNIRMYDFARRPSGGKYEPKIP